MLMHVPKPREDGLSGCIDDSRAVRSRGSRADCRDPVALNDDGRRGDEGRVDRIEQCRVADDDRSARRFVCQSRSQLLHPTLGRRILRFEHGLRRVVVALAENRAPRRDGAEECAVRF